MLKFIDKLIGKAIDTADYIVENFFVDNNTEAVDVIHNSLIIQCGIFLIIE